MDRETGYDDMDPRDRPDPDEAAAEPIPDPTPEPPMPEWMQDPQCDRCGKRRDDLVEKGREFICPDCVFDARMEAAGE